MLFKRKNRVFAPLSGNVITLEETGDEAFSVLGNGVAIEPDSGKVYAPFDGEIINVAETKHALGIKGNGEILIHIGVDTVNLKGKYFNPFVKEGDKVTAGQLIAQFDLQGIKSEGYSVATPVIVISGEEIKNVKTGKVSVNDILFEIG